MKILQTAAILVENQAKTQTEVFATLAKEAVKLGIANEETGVYQGLIAREAESTTGMLDGFAIPHTKSQSILQASIMIIKLRQAIEWQSLDGQKIDFVLALLIPEAAAGETHLNLLSQVAKLLMKADVKAKLKKAESSQIIYQIITSHLGV